MTASKALDGETHDWFIPPMAYFQERKMECCRKCGFIRSLDRQNRPCRGVVKVALRADSQSEKGERDADRKGNR